MDNEWILPLSGVLVGNRGKLGKVVSMEINFFLSGESRSPE